jgi:hypothetical protein
MLPRQPPLAIADSLIEGMVTKAVTVDKDMGLDIETYFRNSLPQYSFSRWPYTQTMDKYSILLPTARPAILSVKYSLVYIHCQRLIY